MKGDKVMKFINNKLYINYSELSPEQKKYISYANQNIFEKIGI